MNMGAWEREKSAVIGMGGGRLGRVETEERELGGIGARENRGR